MPRTRAARKPTPSTAQQWADACEVGADKALEFLELMLRKPAPYRLAWFVRDELDVKMTGEAVGFSA